MSDEQNNTPDPEFDAAAQALKDAERDMAALDALRQAAEAPEDDHDEGGEEIDLGDVADAFEPGTFADSEKLKAELEEVKDALMRALADADNTRKRAAKERIDAGKYAVAGFARDMLDIADNLRRALDTITDEMIADNPQVKNLQEGVAGTEKLMLSTFEKNGIKKLNPKGEVFDPNFHEVMFEAPVPGQAAGTVIEVLEVGYMLNDRLIRPARVGVAKDDGGQAAPPADSGGHIDEEV